jgi:hypothetical protein
MKGINYLAALGTILVFISIYSFKAAFYKKISKENEKATTPVKNDSKILLILFSVACLVGGLLLIAKALKII